MDSVCFCTYSFMRPEITTLTFFCCLLLNCNDESTDIRTLVMHLVDYLHSLILPVRSGRQKEHREHLAPNIPVRLQYIILLPINDSLMSQSPLNTKSQRMKHQFVLPSGIVGTNFSWHVGEEFSMKSNLAPVCWPLMSGLLLDMFRSFAELY